MQNYLILPILIPLFMGISALARFRAIRRRLVVFGATLNMLTCIVLLFIAQTGEIQVTQAGGHPAPFGISLVVDSLTAIMLTITAIIGFAVVIYSYATIDPNRERFAYYPMIGFLLMGINFAFLTGDLFTFYVAFEVMLLASFVLLTLGGERGQLEGGLKYVTLNLISSTLFLIAAGLTYSVAGTLNIADLSQKLADVAVPGITTVLAGMFLLAFGVKAAIFPLFFWLPASYHTPPIPVTALFGGILTKVGIYSMWRVLVLVFPNDVLYLQPLILTLAALTMITGVLGAVAQTELRRLLSFHIVSQIGYLLMGLGLFTEFSLTAAVVFMVHVILAKTALFLVSGVIYEMQGSYQLKKVGGLLKRSPGLALLFVIAAFSLAGFPPFPGFWAKLMLIRAGLETQQYAVVAVALVVSILTLYSMTKIWHEAFWKNAPQPESEQPALKPLHRLSMYFPTVLLVVLIVLAGVLIEPLYSLSERAANGIIEPQAYQQAVLFPNGEAE